MSKIIADKSKYQKYDDKLDKILEDRDRNDYKNIKNDYQLISSKLYMGKVQVRLLDEMQPMEGFEQTSPEIEDIYFSTINQLDTGSES